jgi:PAS domain S-box-containing protein
MHRQIENFRRHLQFAFIVPLLLAIVLGGVFVVQTYYLRNSMQEVQHSYLVQTRARSLLKLLLDMETGLRGYLLTGEDRFLAPYRASSPQVEPALDELANLIGNDAQQSERVITMRDAYHRWDQFAGRMIELKRDSRSVTDVGMNMQGKQIMDEIRLARDEVLQIEEARSRDRIDRVRRIMTTIFVTASVLSLLLGLLLATFSRRELAMVASTYDNALRTSHERTEELHESQRWLTAVLASIGDGVLATDQMGRVVFANDVAVRLLGLQRSEIVGANIGNILKLADEYSHDAVPDVFEEVISSQQHSAIADHTMLVRNNGVEVPVNVVASPIRGSENVSGVVIVVRDLTEQRKSEKTLQSTEKLASIGRLAASVAHEIHNPLDALGNILYLLDHASLDESSRTYLRLAREELERVANISHQVLTFSRESRQPVPVNIAEVFDNVLTLFDARIKRMGVTMVQSLDPKVKIIAFPGELRQVFSNLIGNALDAMGGPGRLTIKAEETHSWHADQEPGIRVLVCDTGSGIPAEVRPKLMDPFVTSKGETGTGLGLWVCRGIVEKYHGSLTYRTSTRAGHSGTCFSVFLPTDTKAAPTSQQMKARVS